MGTISSDQIISILKSKIENYELETSGRETGEVIWVGDGIATVYGLDHAEYGEILLFETGLKGWCRISAEEKSAVSCLAGYRNPGRMPGQPYRKRAGIPVGEAYIGRIIDALGAPIDGKGEITSVQYRPIEEEAPGIIDRQSVTVPLETGILSIDSMFPIGRGQRELIIGDRQTGKTSLALDAILNQKGKNVVCIYVAVGQKASTVAGSFPRSRNTEQWSIPS